jgi:hypothetical protein
VSFHSSYRFGRWMPAGVTRGYGRGPRPEVGETVAYDRGAYIVTHVADAELRDNEMSMTSALPYVLTLRRLHGPVSEYENDRQERGVRIARGSSTTFERYAEGRVPLCSCCGHPWPCLNLDAAEAAKQEAKIMGDKLAKAGIPGTCYSCGEPITTRQESVTYPEPNVELIGYPGPRFHTRQSCGGGWYEYERKRQRALVDVEPLHATYARNAVWGAP